MTKLQKRFIPLIEKHHKRCQQKTKDKLYKSIISKRNNWSKKYGIKKTDIDFLIETYLGTHCEYCGEKVDFKSLSLDHINPIDRGGSKNSISNLHFVCKRCNVRKGTLNDNEYKSLLKFLETLEHKSKKYVLRKLSSRAYF